MPTLTDTAPPSDRDRPNILLLMTDEQRFDQMGCVNPVVQTPHLDALAADGVRFTRGYTANPSCVPSRAALMTGEYPSQCGVPTYVTYLPETETTFMSRLRDAGYHTAVVGKQHFGETDIAHGYDYEEIIDSHFPPPDLTTCQPRNSWFEHLVERGYTSGSQLFEQIRHHVHRWTGPPELHVDRFIGDRALRWLEEDRPADGPWFFCASFPGPHSPIDGHGLPQESLYDPADIDMPQTAFDDLAGKPRHQYIAHGTSEPGELDDATYRKARLGYYANISLIDEQIGRITEHLKQQGLYDNTLILMVSDHGTYVGEFGKLGKSQCLLETLMRVPMLMKRAGGGVRGKQESTLVNLVDIAPTCLAAAGVAIPESYAGRDLAPYGQTEADLNDRERLYMEAGRMRGLRVGDWKIVHYFERDYGELYDLAADPWEKTNLWADPQHRERRDALRVDLLNEIMRLSRRHGRPWNDSSDPPSPEI